MNRESAIGLIRDALGGRRLIWFGTRGDDIEAISGLPELAAAFSVINAYSRRDSVEGLSFESLLGHRVDLDAHDIDDELDGDVIGPFRRSLLRAMAQPCVVFTYRPSTLLSAACFARRDRCTYVGMFKDHQFAFEHKPWVESAVRDLGIPSIPWVYVADQDQLDTSSMLDDGPVMLRRSRSSGGTGLTRVETRDELQAEWPADPEAFVSVAPYLAGGVPVNVGAVVWHDGVTLHPASVQLIGVPGFTNRPFGYCGNDFAAVAQFDEPTLREIEEQTRRVGSWLGEHGYRGAFGVDYLVIDGRPLFTEVNPRFQGSTNASSRLSTEADLPCILLDHLGASFGLDSWGSPSLVELAGASEPLTNLVIHSPSAETSGCELGEVRASLGSASVAARIDVELPRLLPAATGSTLCRVTLRTSVTQSGYSVCAPWDSLPSLIEYDIGQRAETE